MNLIRFALRKPIAILVATLAIVYFSVTVISKINVDIFPEIELPSIYIAMPYGGMSPEHMDGFMANEFQKVLIFVSGVKDIDFKSIQGFTLMKLSFYPGTDMAQAAGEVSTQVSRAMGFLPPGAVPPQVVRFDGSSLPVGQLVFESPKRSIAEIQNLVLTRIRPMFVNIPGVTAPAPFGGNTRTMVINLNPHLLQSYGMSPEEVTAAIAKSNLTAPAGNIRIDKQNLMAPVNSMIRNAEEFLNIPIRSGPDNLVFIRDVATVSDAADQTVGFALVNGKRSVYLPVIKKADASTLKAVADLKASLPMLRETLPDDVQIKYVFDQSGYIANSLTNLIHEGILGAVLTGIMVLIFLGDPRGALIVILTIPIAILAAVMLLYAFGQTINIMTLSGLALAIGILVDEATVTIENIHQHFGMRKAKPRAILDALLEISIPKLLILLCILAVLMPSFMMTGIPKDMFLPLSLAVAFAMIASFIASQTFVPVLANWIMKHQGHKVHKKKNFLDRVRIRYALLLNNLSKKTLGLTFCYIICCIGLIFTAINFIGTDIMPTSNGGDIQVRIRAPEGSRLEVTEEYVKEITNLIQDELPKNAVKITSAYVGTQPSSTAINPIFLFTSTSSEAVLQVAIDQNVFKGKIADFKDSIRQQIGRKFPNLTINFEPVELVEKIMNQGTQTPIEIRIAGNPLTSAIAHAKKIENELAKVPYLRDVSIAEPLNYPVAKINVDREKAAQFGLSMEDVSRAITTATSSTRFTNKNLWVDPKSGLVFQTQVQVPERDMQSLDRLRALPLKKESLRPILEDIAQIQFAKIPAQVNRQGPNRYVSVIANTHHSDLGTASRAVDKAIKDAGDGPRGIRIKTIGSLQLLTETLASLQSGLLVAVITIFLMLSAYYQSFKVSGLILSVVPAVVAGSLLCLLLFGSTLNLQSYMGMIMSIGVSVSNAVLLINQAELYRQKLNLPANIAAKLAATSRFRPILMTTAAMIAGMIPMASGMGEGGEQVAPLGQAVIGGLLLSTCTVLLVLPNFFSASRANATRISPSLDPDDPESKFALNKSH